MLLFSVRHRASLIVSISVDASMQGNVGTVYSHSRLRDSFFPHIWRRWQTPTRIPICQRHAINSHDHSTCNTIISIIDGVRFLDAFIYSMYAMATRIHQTCAVYVLCVCVCGLGLGRTVGAVQFAVQLSRTYIFQIDLFGTFSNLFCGALLYISIHSEQCMVYECRFFLDA